MERNHPSLLRNSIVECASTVCGFPWFTIPHPMGFCCFFMDVVVPPSSHVGVRVRILGEIATGDPVSRTPAMHSSTSAVALIRGFQPGRHIPGFCSGPEAYHYTPSPGRKHHSGTVPACSAMYLRAWWIASCMIAVRSASLEIMIVVRFFLPLDLPASIGMNLLQVSE